MISALDATLALYETPERPIEELPVLRLLTRAEGDIREQAERLCPAITRQLGDKVSVSIRATSSQIGSGALPVDLLPSAALCLEPVVPARRRGRAARDLAAAFRALPRPVIGRVADNRVLFDLRCLDDEAAFVEQLAALDLSGLEGGV